MIPLWDTQKSLARPVVVPALIVANLALFVYEFSLGPELQALLDEYGLIPAEYFRMGKEGLALSPRRYLPILTSMFLHGGWLHVIINMLFLWVFGDNVEDRLGRLRFVAFYLACGSAGALLQVYLSPGSERPMVGASGAIAGVMGGYLLLFPRARVVAVIPFLYFFQVIALPAFFFLAFWFLIQFFSGTVASLSGAREAAGTAWWAHIGGFAAGASLVKLLENRQRRLAEAQMREQQRRYEGGEYGATPDETIGDEPRWF